MTIIPIYMIMSIFITLLIMYLLYPDPIVIIEYPNVKNKISNVYTDDNGIKYRYYREKLY